jgi:hypothetical protein
MKEFFNKNKYLIFIACIFVIILGIIIVIIQILQDDTNTKITTSPQVPQEINPVFQTKINETPENIIKEMDNIKTTRPVAQGTEYSFPSLNLSSDNTIITNNNTVIFEKRFTADANFKHPELSYYLSLLGDPEAMIPGSKIYGTSVNYYIYAAKGVTVIGRPFSDEVEEIQQYQPTTVDDYVKLWGENILEHTDDDHDHP